MCSCSVCEIRMYTYVDVVFVCTMRKSVHNRPSLGYGTDYQIYYDYHHHYYHTSDILDSAKYDAKEHNISDIIPIHIVIYCMVEWDMLTIIMKIAMRSMFPRNNRTRRTHAAYIFTPHIDRSNTNAEFRELNLFAPHSRCRVDGR